MPQRRYHALNESRLFMIHAIVIWVILCVPGNLLTAILLYQDHVQPDSVDSTNGTQAANDSLLEQSPSSAIDEEHLNVTQDLETLANTHCYELLSESVEFRQKFRFWCEGFSITLVGLVGLAGNMMTFLVLRKSSSSFHRLLIGLAGLDSLLIVDMLIEKAIIGTFLGEDPLWYKLSYPFFWHPVKGMINDCTIFMVVAVSAERYRAICHPLSDKQSPFKYIGLVVVVAVCMGIPRFFQFKLVDNQTEYWTSKIMENPIYIRFSSYWEDVIATGILPIVALIVFNTKIYLTIRSSSRMKCKFVSKSPAIVKQPSCSISTNVCFRMESIHRSRANQVTIRALDVNHPSERCQLRIEEDEIDVEAITDGDPVLRCGSVSVVQNRLKRSAYTLVGIVVLFIACHSYRLALKIYELANPESVTMNHFEVCFELGRHHVPVAMYVLHNFHYVFLVLNSSVNFVIYCCSGTEFRAKMLQLFQRPSRVQLND